MQKGEKLLWDGPSFGRLTKDGKKYLITQKGWTAIQKPQNETLSFPSKPNHRLAMTWPSKSGPQFEMNDPQAAHIRPYPKQVTDVLDDKLRLANLLLESGCDILPNHIFSPEQAASDRLYFVKHRYGAQGKSVYVYNKSELQDWWETSNNPQDFVIQEEVVPSTFGGRKFVLRSHILLFHRRDVSSECESIDAKQFSPLTFQSYLHKQVIVQHHAAPYERFSKNKASQISQVGKSHPIPVLLQNLPSNHPAVSLFPQIQLGSKVLMSAFENWFTAERIHSQFPSTVLAPETTCFALLGLDWFVQSPSSSNSSCGDVELKLCEVNSHPALGWGTMAQVPSIIFKGLVEQTIDCLMEQNHLGTEGNQFLSL